MIIADIIAKPFRWFKPLCILLINKLNLNKDESLQYSMKDIKLSGMSVRQRDDIAVLNNQTAIHLTAKMLITILMKWCLNLLIDTDPSCPSSPMRDL